MGLRSLLQCVSPELLWVVVVFHVFRFAQNTVEKLMELSVVGSSFTESERKGAAVSMFRMEIKCTSPFYLSLILIQAFADTLRWTQLPYGNAPLYTWLMMVEFEGRIFCARTVNEARKRRFLIKKTYDENEGNKMIIIWLSFSKKQTNKKKEKRVCPKGFLLSLTTSDFFSSTRPTSVHWKSLQVE